MNAMLILRRLEMDVRRAVFERFPDDLVDELDDAGLLVAFGDFFVGGQIQFHRSGLSHFIQRFGAFSISALVASANCTGPWASKRTALTIEMSNGLLTATCSEPLVTSVGN